MQITVRVADDELRRFQNMAGALGEKQARLAYARAVNRVTNSVHGKVISAVVKQTSIPRRIVKQEVKKQLARPAGDGAVQGIIYAKGKPISLKHFNPKQFSWGVRVKAWGEWQRLEGSFIYGGTWRSGKPAFNGHVMTRVGKNSFPVRQENGPSVPAGLISGEATTIFTKTVEDMLPRRVMHELSRLLGI